MVSRLAVAALITKELLSPVLKRPALAVNRLVPVTLMLRSLKVDRPLAAVVRMVVPLKLPVPLLRLMVTDSPETLFPKSSCARTVTGGLIAVPAAVSVGCWTKLMLVAAAALTVKRLLKPGFKPLALAAS